MLVYIRNIPIHAYCCQNDKCVDESRRVVGWVKECGSVVWLKMMYDVI